LFSCDEVFVWRAGQLIEASIKLMMGFFCSKNFSEDAKYRKMFFSTCPEDRMLFAQVSTHVHHFPNATTEQASNFVFPVLCK
jgi:hypothetical protein